ncbi:MAG: dienelactone hydrolase family protein [Sphingomonadaceae bacterium]|nr:dienelactone hydrolase family protein [Sphingomonadaceae bacterium]
MIRTEPLRYDGPGGPFAGTISWDDSSVGPRPGVLVVHTVAGRTDAETRHAEALAALGYAALAVDLYGEAHIGAPLEEARALMNALNSDRPLLAARMRAGHEALKRHLAVDPSRTAAIGFCFGGKAVLDLARSGTDVKAVASFHGIFDPPPDADDSPISAAVLMLHGWEDPLAPPEAVEALAAELTRRGADWQILAFGHAGHSFTNPAADRRPEGFFHEPRAAARAWAAMERFLEETLG